MALLSMVCNLQLTHLLNSVAPQFSSIAPSRVCIATQDSSKLDSIKVGTTLETRHTYAFGKYDSDESTQNSWSTTCGYSFRYSSEALSASKLKEYRLA